MLQCRTSQLDGTKYLIYIIYCPFRLIKIYFENISEARWRPSCEWVANLRKFKYTGSANNRPHIALSHTATGNPAKTSSPGSTPPKMDTESLKSEILLSLKTEISAPIKSSNSSQPPLLQRLCQITELGAHLCATPVQRGECFHFPTLQKSPKPELHSPRSESYSTTIRVSGLECSFQPVSVSRTTER